MHALVRALKFSAFGLGAISLLICWAASTYFYSHRPVAPCAEENRTYALNIHGLTVYLTREEHRLIDWTFVATFCFYAVTVILLAIENEMEFRRRG